jgi:diguanylate cyclase (GGDEF)-like protein
MADHRDRVLDIAVAVNSARSLDELIGVVMKRVGELLPFDRASIALRGADDDALVLHDLTSRVPSGDVAAERGKKIPIREDNVLGWVFLHGEPHLRRNDEDMARFRPAQGGREVEAHIICPLRGRREILGLLNIGSFTPEAFRPEDVPLFAGYARLTAVAIENLRNFERAREAGIRDGLTGAFNHRHFNDSLEREHHRVQRYGGALSLLLLDVDHFKAFNDRFGHQAGDQVLVKTVALIQGQLRPTDQVFRYGGEEFAVLLPSVDAGQCASVASKLLRVLRASNSYSPDRSTTLSITASIGGACAPEDAETPEALLACADQAMYRAKAGGRDGFIAFSDIAGAQQLDQELERRVGAVPDALFVEDAAVPACHNQRMIRMADDLASSLGLPAEQRINLRIAAFYHDIGEVGIPRELLERPGPLDARERTLVRSHPVVGESLLRRVLRIGEVLLAVLHHKERFDGSGYPARLHGKEIPLLARILAVVEVYDALTSERPYRKARNALDASRMLLDAAGYQLDPDLVERFLQTQGQASASMEGGG